MLPGKIRSVSQLSVVADAARIRGVYLNSHRWVSNELVLLNGHISGEMRLNVKHSFCWRPRLSVYCARPRATREIEMHGTETTRKGAPLSRMPGKRGVHANRPSANEISAPSRPSSVLARTSIADSLPRVGASVRARASVDNSFCADVVLLQRDYPPQGYIRALLKELWRHGLYASWGGNKQNKTCFFTFFFMFCFVCF